MPALGPGRAAALVARALVLGACVSLLVVPWSSSHAARTCEQPTLVIEGAPGGVVALRRGQEITVTGRNFVDCGGGGGGPFPGCGRAEPPAEPAPLTGVELELVGGRVTRREVTLGVADAGTAAQDRLGEISWTVQIPERQAQGPALLQAEGASGFGVGVAVQIRAAD